MADMKKNWYVLRSISGKELKVKELLEAVCKNNADIAKYITNVLVPTEKVYTTRAGKRVLKERVSLSGYVFVEAVLTGDIESMLQNTTNVIDFVRSREGGKKPEPVSEAEIRRMMGAAEAESDLNEEIANDFIVGQSVKVTDGPFSGFMGLVSEVNREKHELTVLVKVFDRESPLKLDNSQVERM